MLTYNSKFKTGTEHTQTSPAPSLFKAVANTFGILSDDIMFQPLCDANKHVFINRYVIKYIRIVYLIRLDAFNRKPALDILTSIN